MRRFHSGWRLVVVRHRRRRRRLLVAPATAVAAPADLSGSIADQVEPAVVRIDTVINYQHAIGAGTGIVIDGGGPVLTNFHVVQGADIITATGRRPPYPARSRRLRPRPRHRGAAAARRRRPADGRDRRLVGRLAVGDPVVALGNARGSGSPLTHEAGTVIGFGRTISAKDELTGSSETEVTGLIEFAAPVRAGDSGGPLVNAAGQVVGVTTAATVNFRMDPGGEGFAIPINDAMAIGQSDPLGTPSDTVHIGPPTLLGVGVSSADQHESLPGRHRARGAAAAARPSQAGLLDGDVLLSIDGDPDRFGDRPDRRTRTGTTPATSSTWSWIDRAGQQRTGKATLTSGG